MKFIRKNGKVIPIREKGEKTSQQKADQQTKIANKKDKKATKYVEHGMTAGGLAGAVASSGSYKRRFGVAMVGMAVGAIAGGVLARLKGYSSSKNRQNAEDHQINADWEKKKKAYAKMNKKGRK